MMTLFTPGSRPSHQTLPPWQGGKRAAYLLRVAILAPLMGY